MHFMLKTKNHRFLQKYGASGSGLRLQPHTIHSNSFEIIKRNLKNCKNSSKAEWNIHDNNINQLCIKIRDY